MALVVICWQPCSGKSTAAACLADAIQSVDDPKPSVRIIDESSLHLGRNQSYAVKMILISQSVLLNERKGNKLDREVADEVVDDEVQEVDLIEEIKLKKSKKISVKADDFSQKKKKKSKSIDMNLLKF